MARDTLNIPPHNLGECIDGVIALIDNPDIEVDELMEYITAPDFDEGEVDREVLRKSYKRIVD